MFTLPEPERTHALQEFLNPNNDAPVKLKPAQGTLQVNFRGEKVTVPPAGKWFGRRSAVDFLLAFGEQGIYRHKDRATGLTQAMLDQMDHAEREQHLAKGVKILENYVYHVLDDDDTEEGGDA
jgi:hypothetical protein